MHKEMLSFESRRLVIAGFVLLAMLAALGMPRATARVRGGGECVPRITVKSGNGNEGETDPQVQFFNGMAFQDAFIIPPHVDNDGQPPDTDYSVIAGTHYVAVTPDGHGAEQTDHFFKTSFTMPAGYTNPSFSIQVHCDNQATIILNGNNLGSQPFAEDVINFQDPAEEFSTSNPAHFVTGTNVLEITAHNFTDRIALDFKADICFDIDTPITCESCDEGTVVVDQNVTVDLNPAVPTCSGDPDLCAFFTFDKSGPTPDTWKAIFDVGAKKLLVKNGATITVATSPVCCTNNRKSPGIEIKTTCTVEVEEGGAIVVQSVNQKAGDIFIQAGGNITINGKVSNSVTGTNGFPGDITIASCCGGITTGPNSLIQTLGQDPGGSDINLLACGGSEGGDIVINGLVDASYKAAVPSTINIASFAGAVTINGNNFQGIEAGTKRPITSGVTVRTRRDPLAGFINIQAQNDLTVLGNRLLDDTHPNLGAVAVKSHSTNGNGGDGAIVAVSLGGRIVASDRAFDFTTRFNALNEISLSAAGNIDLSVTASIDDGAPDNSKPVVNSRGGSSGKGGTNTLRSYGAGILIGVNAFVLADFVGTPGSNGANLLTSCTGVVNSGTVLPADGVPGDDIGVCAPAAPAPILSGCEQFQVTCGPSQPPKR